VEIPEDDADGRSIFGPVLSRFPLTISHSRILGSIPVYDTAKALVYKGLSVA